MSLRLEFAKGPTAKPFSTFPVSSSGARHFALAWLAWSRLTHVVLPALLTNGSMLLVPYLVFHSVFLEQLTRNCDWFVDSYRNHPAGFDIQISRSLRQLFPIISGCMPSMTRPSTPTSIHNFEMALHCPIDRRSIDEWSSPSLESKILLPGLSLPECCVNDARGAVIYQSLKQPKLDLYWRFGGPLCKTCLAFCFLGKRWTWPDLSNEIKDQANLVVAGPLACSVCK